MVIVFCFSSLQCLFILILFLILWQHLLSLFSWLLCLVFFCIASFWKRKEAKRERRKKMGNLMVSKIVAPIVSFKLLFDYQITLLHYSLYHSKLWCVWFIIAVFLYYRLNNKIFMIELWNTAIVFHTPFLFIQL